jgi:DNA-binding protein YbaB
MTAEMHPQVAAVLKQAERLQSLVDEQLNKMAQGVFTATDETETVEVTLDGHHLLKDLFIEQGLLRLGVETVQARINEALQRASAKASEAIQADRSRIDTEVEEITSELHLLNANISRG